MPVGEKREYKFVLPDGSEHFDSVFYDNNRLFRGIKEVAQTIVSRSGITTSRQNPQEIAVKVFRLEIEKGKLKETAIDTHKVMPPMERMTKEEYESELKDLLDQVAPAFHPMVRQRSWEEGHSAGYEEVILIADNLVSALKPAITQFLKDIRVNK